MRRFLLLVATFLFPLVAFSQNSSLLKDAQDLFAAGDYSAAVTKFQEAVNKLSGRERNIAQIQLGTAQTCVTALSKAKAAESSKDFDTAINEYQKIIDANPNDTKVKGLQEAARKSKREANPTLTVSKSSLSFSSSGGTQTITVNCSMDWTLVDQTSSICSVSRSGNVITVTCTSNSTTSARNTSFLVKTVNGAKEQRISISQTGRVSTSSTTSSTSSSRSSTASRLEVKPTSISLSSGSGTALVDVTTDANDYNVSLLPSWAKLKSKYGTFFSLSYTENTSTTPRSDWFNVTAGGKTVKVTITQSGRGSSRSTTYSSSTSSSSSSASRLTVKPTSLLLEGGEGTTLVDISTDAKDYQITDLPSWLKLKNKYDTFFSLTYLPNNSSSQRSDWFTVKAGGRSVRVNVTQRGRFSALSGSGNNGYRRNSSNRNKGFTIGIDFNFDYFGNYYSNYGYSDSYSDFGPYSVGVGLRARIGRYDQWFNLIGGARYVYGEYKSGVMVPVLLNLNLIKLDPLTLYIGGGYEFWVYGNYFDDYLVQAGMLIGPHTDFQFIYKPNQEIIGAGFTVYF